MKSESSNNFNKIYTQFDWKVLQHVLLQLKKQWKQ